jgi:hypothetical protein
MFISTNNLVNLAYVTSIGLGGGFLAKTAAQATIWSWNQCTSEKRNISLEIQKKIIKAHEISEGFFFAILAAREIFSENAILKQIKTLKNDLRDLDKEVSDLFKMIYSSGKDAIHNFQLKI